MALSDNTTKITSFQAVESRVNAKMFKLFVTQEFTNVAVIGLKKDVYTIFYINIIYPDNHNVDLVKALNKELVYIKNTNRILNIKVVDSNVVVDNKTNETLLEYTTIIMIQNSPIVESVIRFKLTPELEFVYNVVLDITFNQIYSQYGDSVLQKHFSWYGKYFAVSYYHPQKQ